MILPAGVEVTYVDKMDLQVPEAGFIGQMAGENYYHFLTECLPRLLLLKKALPAETFRRLPIIVPGGKASVVQYLALLGIEPRLILRHNETTRIHVSRLHTVDWRSTDTRPDLQFYAPRVGLQMVRRALRGRLTTETIAGLARSRPAIVYISRNDTSHRHVKNEYAMMRAVAEALPEYDVVTHLGGNSTGQKALELFSRAVVVVGSHGAGLGNVILCRPGTALIEFSLPSPQMRYYAHLAVALDLLYEPLPWIEKFREDIEVDPAAVSREVKKMVAKAVEGGWKDSVVEAD